MPYSRNSPTSFWPISPKAVLLMGEKTTTATKDAKKNAGKGHAEKRAGCFACGLKLFSVLIFGLLFYQVKSNSLRGN